jgi:hypothetical protein
MSAQFEDAVAFGSRAASNLGNNFGQRVEQSRTIALTVAMIHVHSKLFVRSLSGLPFSFLVRTQFHTVTWQAWELNDRGQKIDLSSTRIRQVCVTRSSGRCGQGQDGAQRGVDDGA